jgi:hypothetical protein
VTLAVAARESVLVDAGAKHARGAAQAAVDAAYAAA